MMARCYLVVEASHRTTLVILLQLTMPLYGIPLLLELLAILHMIRTVSPTVSPQED